MDVVKRNKEIKDQLLLCKMLSEKLFNELEAKVYSHPDRYVEKSYRLANDMRRLRRELLDLAFLVERYTEDPSAWRN